MHLSKEMLSTVEKHSKDNFYKKFYENKRLSVFNEFSRNSEITNKFS